MCPCAACTPCALCIPMRIMAFALWAACSPISGIYSITVLCAPRNFCTLCSHHPLLLMREKKVVHTGLKVIKLYNFTHQISARRSLSCNKKKMGVLMCRLRRGSAIPAPSRLTTSFLHGVVGSKRSWGRGGLCKPSCHPPPSLQAPCLPCQCCTLLLVRVCGGEGSVHFCAPVVD